MPIIKIQKPDYYCPDAFINSDFPDDNFGAREDLGVNWVPAGLIVHSLVKFDLSALPVNAVIVSAKYKFYVSFINGTTDLFFILPDAGWEELGVTWNNAPAPGGGVQDMGVDSVGWKEMDLTYEVRDWYTGVVPNNGLYIVEGFEAGVTIVWPSMDVIDPTYRPYLEIDYYQLPTGVEGHLVKGKLIRQPSKKLSGFNAYTSQCALLKSAGFPSPFPSIPPVKRKSRGWVELLPDFFFYQSGLIYFKWTPRGDYSESSRVRLFARRLDHLAQGQIVATSGIGSNIGNISSLRGAGGTPVPVSTPGPYIFQADVVDADGARSAPSNIIFLKI